MYGEAYISEEQLFSVELEEKRGEGDFASFVLRHILGAEGEILQNCKVFVRRINGR